MKATTCPNCGYRMEAATNLGGEDSPSPGDWSLCLNCGRLLRFTEDLGLRGATVREEVEMDDANRETISRAQAAIRERGVLR